MKNYGLAVPTYNRISELLKLLDSIPNSVNIYVSDNGGTVPSSIQDTYSNLTIKKNLPVVQMFSNWNLAANLVTEEWLAVPSDDDIYFPGSFNLFEKYSSQHQEMDMIIFGHNVIDANDKIIGTWSPDDVQICIPPSGFIKFRYGVNARMPSIFIKTSLFHKLGGFCEEFSFTASDSDFLQRASLIANILFVPEVISGYRVWEGGATSDKIGTHEWMLQIDHWCNRISNFCNEQSINLYSSKIHDEIYGQNLLGGIANLKKNRGYHATWSHFRKCRYPVRATLRTQLRLIYWLIRP